MAKPRLTAGMVLLLAAGAAAAGDWELRAAASARLSWTDNLRLTDTGEESGAVLELAPTLRARRAGARLQVDASYRLQQFLYSEGFDQARTWHQFQGRAAAELVREYVFVDASANYGQALINPDAALPVGNLGITSNRTNVGSVSVSPYARFRLGHAATGTLRYRFTRTDTGVSGTSSRSDVYSAQVASTARFDRLGWSLGWTSSRRDYSGRPDFERDVATASLRLRVTPRLSLVASGGREDNSYQRLPGTEAPEGTFWNAGLLWTPSRRTSFEARGGERFFGRTWLAKASLRTRRAVLDASYSEDLSTVQRLIEERQLFVLTDPFGNPILIGGVPAVIEVSFPALTAEVFLRRRGTLSWSYRTARSVLGLGLYDERREYQTTAESERIRGGRASWDWRLARRTHSVLGYTQQVRDRRGGAGEDRLRTLSWTLSRRMRPDLSGTLTLRRVRRDGDGSVRDYRQNVVTLGVTATF